MITLDFRGINETVSTLKNVQKQVAFATSKAINNTAKAVQKMEIEKELPGSLKIRSRWFKPGTRFGVNIKFSNKTNLVAVVGSRADWLTLVEHGGTKKPSKRAIAVPSTYIDTNRVRKKSEKPAALIKSGKGFIIKGKTGKASIFTRTTGGIKPLYFFASSGQVKDQLNFHETGVDLVRRTYLTTFSQEIQKAIMSAK